jgi:hypothetical protein
MNWKPMWLVALLAAVLAVSPLFAADTAIRGKIKAVNADKNEFTLEDANAKSQTITLDKDVIINRGGKEVKFADMKVGDDVSVCYSQGIFKGTAHYVFVHDENSKNVAVGSGKFKAYDPNKGELVVTDYTGADVTLMAPATSKVMINNQAGKITDVKANEMVTILVDTKDGKQLLRELVVQRK